MKAGTAWLEPNAEPVPCGAAPPAEKLKEEALPGPGAPPKTGAELLVPWLGPAPNIPPPAPVPLGVEALPLPPPNWNGDEVPDGADPAPKENVPPDAGAAAVPALPPIPDANGLLKPPVGGAAALPPPKLKLKPPEPEPAFDDGPPKLAGAALAVLPFCVGAEDAPKMLFVTGAAVEAPPKLKIGVESPPLLPLLNAFFFAGDGSSCFMGLPNMLFDAPAAGGDVGAPNMGFEAVVDGAAVVLGPKLKMGFGASALAAVELVVAPEVAPNRGCCGCVVGVVAPLPNKLPAVLAGLEPKSDPALAGADAVVAPVPPNKEVAGLGASVVKAFAGSEGLAPNRVEGVNSAGLLA